MVQGKIHENDLTTIKTFKRDLLFLKLTKGIEEKDAYIKVMENADTELKNLIVKKEIASLESLKKEIDKIEEEKKSIDQMILIGCKNRPKSVPVKLYLEERIKELFDLELKEATIIKIIASNIWPGNDIIRMFLEKAETINDLRFLVDEQEKRMKESRNKKSSFKNKEFEKFTKP